MRHLQHCNCWNYNSITFHGLRNSLNRHGCAQCMCGGRNQAWRSIAQRPGFGSTLSIHKRVNWSEEFRKIKLLWSLSSMVWSRKSNWNLSWWLALIHFAVYYFIYFFSFHLSHSIHYKRRMVWALFVLLPQHTHWSGTLNYRMAIRRYNYCLLPMFSHNEQKT